MKTNMSAKTQLIVAAAILAVVAVVLCVLYISTKKESDVVIKDDSFEITGLYGRIISFGDVESIELKDSMPATGRKTNGAGLGEVKKGYFDVSGLGNSLLFVHTNNGPFIFIDTKERMVIINYSDAGKTKAAYQDLLSAWNK